MIDSKTVTRQIEYAQYSNYALTMTSIVLVGTLQYFKILNPKSSLALVVTVCAMSYFGGRVLNKLWHQSISSQDRTVDEIVLQGRSK
jgi:hypothetical protein